MAENKRVWRCAGMRLMMRCRSGKNPISSIRSASSSTKIWTCERSAVLEPRWSSKRPGVAIKISTPARRVMAWGLISTPPKTTAVRKSVCLAYKLALSATWSLNSRVGVRIRARMGWRAGDVLALELGNNFWMIGSVNAAVFPVPVWAAPITSRPSKTIGMAFAWMGVACV